MLPKVYALYLLFGSESCTNVSRQRVKEKPSAGGLLSICIKHGFSVPAIQNQGTARHDPGTIFSP